MKIFEVFFTTTVAFNDSGGSKNVTKTPRKLQQTLKFVKGGSQGLY